MSKNTQFGTVNNRIGYGPVIVPPLIIISLFSFSFLFIQAHNLNSQKGTAASTTQQNVTKNQAGTGGLADTQFKALEPLQTVTPPAPAAAAAPFSTPVTTSPQAVSTTTNSSLQSASQSTAKSTSSLKSTITSVANQLKVNTNKTQTLKK